MTSSRPEIYRAAKIGNKWKTTEKLLTDWFENTSTHTTTPRRMLNTFLPGMTT